MIEFHTDFVAAGGNRHPAAADWDVTSGLLAYGAENNIALWKPLVVHVSMCQCLFLGLLMVRTEWSPSRIALIVAWPCRQGYCD